jgi:hypothetical protein
MKTQLQPRVEIMDSDSDDSGVSDEEPSSLLRKGVAKEETVAEKVKRRNEDEWRKEKTQVAGHKKKILWSFFLHWLCAKQGA